MTDYSSEEFWKGAPADAQAFMPASHQWIDGWWKKKGDQFYFWPFSLGESGGWAPSYARPFDHPDVVMRPAPPWSGDGLPPVGTVCDVTPHNTIWGFSVVDTYGCTVLAYHDDFVWVDIGTPGVPVATRIDKVDFAPIKTPAQIAAEEREAAIGRMKECFDSVSDDLCPTSNQYLETLFGALHDAGYRLTAGDDK